MRLMQQKWLINLGLIIMFCAGCAMAQPGVLTFDKHNIVLYCYDASDMKISYGKHQSHGLYEREYTPNHERKIARAKQPSDDTKFLAGGMGDYRAFEGLLYVQWHALDDSVIKTTVDLDELFPNKIIPHKEDPKRIYWPIPTPRLPFIVIEVNDRTLNIYSDVDVLLLPEDGNVSNKKSHRNRTLVFSKTY